MFAVARNLGEGGQRVMGSLPWCHLGLLSSGGFMYSLVAGALAVGGMIQFPVHVCCAVASSSCEAVTESRVENAVL